MKNRILKQFLRAWPAVLLLSLLLLGRPAMAQSPEVSGDVMAALADGETVRVIVALQPGAAEAGPDGQVEALGGLPETEFTLVHRYETLPGLVGEVTPAGLEALLNRPEVAAVALDLPVEAALTESAIFIHADKVWRDFGLTGAGVNVAVLDTGVEATHPDLADHIIAQHCFNQGVCPPDGTNEGNSATDENGHGTLVSGIITGRGEIAPQGIAPDAGIVAVRVLGRGGTGSTSDVLAGIDWVVAHQAELQVRIINLSLGGGIYEGQCDEADATTRLYAAAVDRARQAGITIFAASGNAGRPDAMMAPACISGVVAVGNVYDTAQSRFTWPTCTDQNTLPDQIPCSSNSSSGLDLLAPGVSITGPGLGSRQDTRSGTSMSTPHAAAVAALVLQANPDLSPPEVEAALLETGVPVTDSRNDRITPRLDALAAVSRVTGGQAGTLAGTVLLAGRTDHSGTRIFLSEADCATPQFGDPMGETGADGRFQLALPPGQTYHCLQARQAGYLVGQADTLPAELGTLTLPAGDVTGDGRIDIFDLALIGSRYGSHDAMADLNADGTVNIFDLVLPASAYGQQGPVTAWQ